MRIIIITFSCCVRYRLQEDVFAAFSFGVLSRSRSLHLFSVFRSTSKDKTLVTQQFSISIGCFLTCLGQVVIVSTIIRSLFVCNVWFSCSFFRWGTLPYRYAPDFELLQPVWCALNADACWASVDYRPIMMIVARRADVGRMLHRALLADATSLRLQTAQPPSSVQPGRMLSIPLYCAFYYCCCCCFSETGAGVSGIPFFNQEFTLLNSSDCSCALPSHFFCCSRWGGSEVFLNDPARGRWFLVGPAAQHLRSCQP